MLRITKLDKEHALLNRLRYRKAKDKQTGYSTSNETWSSLFSFSELLSVIEPLPCSDYMDIFIYSFYASIVT